MSDGKQFSMGNYIDVAERISNFNQQYPDGSLQTLSWDVKEVGGRTFIVYHAAAYRTPDDTRPGHGTAWEPFPGSTSFTKDSELMNAETAAWGRAIVACGLTSNRKIATKQDIQNRQPQEQSKKLPPSLLAQLRQGYTLTGWDVPMLHRQLEQFGVKAVEDLSIEQAQELLAVMSSAAERASEAQ